ncbi:MAG: DUF262 domain-containing protein [Chloroflexi bacterium]|nr:DUF262 domain-containing protein [Chloroflexota bacterium]
MNKGKFDVDAVSVQELFGNIANRFTVPRYQRRYAWDDEHVETLCSDIWEAVQAKEDDYFLGALVLSKTENGHLETIDGQQRLATVTTLLAVLRDKFHQLELKDAAQKLQEYIIRTDLRSNEIPVLTLGALDAEDFYKYVQLPLTHPQREAPGTKKPIGRPGRPPKNFVRNAYDLLSKWAEESVAALDSPKKQETLLTLADFVMRKLTFISTEVASDDQAYIIFETLNDRGLDLSIADLLKNHLFSLAAKLGPAELDTVSVLWQQLTTTMEGVALPKFLRHHWLSHHGVVTQRKLYTALKEHLKKAKKVPRSFLNELITDAQIYARLVAPKQEDLEALTLRDLNLMGVTQHLPFLLAAKQALKEKQFSEIVKLVESLTMRYLVVGNQNPNKLERSYSEWAILIRRGGTGDGLQAKANDLLTQVPSFEEGFKSLTNLPPAHVRYILRKIEEHKTSKELTIAWSGVEIEHILPQTPSDAWVEAIGLPQKVVEQLSSKLGNLTLLSKPLNKKVSNKPFQIKLQHYKQTKIKITQDLERFNSWDNQTIEQRQSEFAALAMSLWPV